MNDVCSAVNHYEGATWSTIMDAMDYYFTTPYIPTQLNSYLSASAIKVVIGNDDPAFMSSLNTTGDSAHITALCGYRESNGKMQIRIMNSGTGEIEWGNYSSSAPYSYAYNGTTYTWDKTVRLLYNV